MFMLITLMAFSVSVSAQSKAITMVGSDAATDTVTNAGTTYLTSPSLAAYTTGKFAVSLKVTNVSGTSTFKAILQGSNDGSTWAMCSGLPVLTVLTAIRCR